MPALPAIRVHAFVTLERELRHRGSDALVEAAQRAAALVHEIASSSTDASFPTEYIVFRILGERATLDGPVLTSADAIALVCTLVERLTEHASLSLDHPLVVGALTSEELATLWNVSKKTLDRLRRQGLPAVRARHPRAHSVLRFPLPWLRNFESFNAARLTKAGAFARVPASLEATFVRRAQRYQRVLGYSLNQAALRIAKRFHKSHEGVRLILQRHAASAPNLSAPTHPALLRAAFAHTATTLRAPKPPMREKEREFLARAWQLGIPMRDLTRRTRKSPATIRRAIAMARHSKLQALVARLPNDVVHAPFANLSLAADAILAPKSVRTNLTTPTSLAQWPTDLAEVITMARTRVVPVAAEESARATAMHFLRWRAATTLAKLNAEHPSAMALEAIEADLVWASRLRARLVRTHLTLVVETLEVRSGTPLSSIASSQAIQALTGALRSAAAAADHFDPAGKGRLAAAVGIAVDRYAATWARTRGVASLPLDALNPKPVPSRATRVLVPGFAFLDLRSIVQGPAAELELSTRIAREVVHLSDLIHRAILIQRYGLESVPMGLRDVAKEMNMTPLAAGRIAHAAYLAALTSARSRAATV